MFRLTESARNALYSEIEERVRKETILWETTDFSKYDEKDWAEFKNVGKPVAIDYSDDAFFELEYLMEFKFNRGEPIIMEMQKCEETITKTAWEKEFSRSDFTIE